MMRFLFASLLVLSVVAAPCLAADDTTPKPYRGEIADRSLEATLEARIALQEGRAAMKDWTKEQWQSWADERFSGDTSPDGSTWRDWKKAQIKFQSDSTLHRTLLSNPATSWEAEDWRMFVEHIDYDYDSPDKYICVILPSGQHRGKFLLGRWAMSMYDENLPERQSWEAKVSQEGSMSSADVKLLLNLQQANTEITSIMAGLVLALVLAITWRW